MSEKYNNPIEQRIKQSLNQSKTQPDTRIQENLLQALRAKQQSPWQRIHSYYIPVWQAAAAVLLLGFLMQQLFPKTIIEEKTIVQTEMQPQYFFHTDTIIQTQTVEKIVHVEVFIPAPAPPKTSSSTNTFESNNPIFVKQQSSDLETTIAQTTPPKKVSSTPTPTQRGRSIQEDAHLMDFITENEHFSTMPVQLRNK